MFSSNKCDKPSALTGLTQLRLRLKSIVRIHICLAAVRRPPLMFVLDMVNNKAPQVCVTWATGISALSVTIMSTTGVLLSFICYYFFNLVSDHTEIKTQ